jgi:flagellar motor switch protein FliM
MARRPLTEIELRLVSRVTDLLLGQLRAAWQDVLELNPRVEQVEYNPQLAQVAPPSERVVLIRFQVALGKARGTVNLAIPSTAVEQIRAKLSADGEAGGAPIQGRAESVEELSRRLRSAVVGLEVCLAQARITTGELIGLQIGDMITTEQDAGSPISVRVEGVPKFRAVAGAHDGHKAIRIEEVLDRSR